MNNKSQIQQAYQLHEQGKLAEAKKCYQELLAEDPEQLDVLHALAVLLAQSQKYDDALLTLNKALAINDKLASLHNSKGNVYMRLAKYDLAIKHYQQAIICDPQYAIAYNNLGNAFNAENQLDSAQEYYQKAIAMVDDYSDAHFNLGILLTKLGETESAITHLKKTLALNPNRGAAYGQLAEVYLHNNDLAHAIDYYQRRLDLEPEHTESYFSLGQAYLKNNGIEDAIAAFKKTLILQPKHHECNHYLGNAELAAGDPNKALNYYFRQLAVQPMMESFYNIGVLLMHQNRFKESVEYLEQAAKEDPEYLPTHINLGGIYLKMNRISDAIRHYKAAQQLKPDDPEIQHILSALSKTDIPDKAPSQYLSHLFDQYANYYDKHLTEHLQYSAHTLLLKAIQEDTVFTGPECIILDLGCGTGLCGQLFKPFAKKIIGIDVSEEMLNAAAKKNIYDVLKVEEVETALAEFTHNDLIIAGDVFSYIGKLDLIFTKAYKALNPKGAFAFTVEKTYTEPYELQKTIRYAHSQTYLETIAKQNDFDIVRFDNIVLRKQRNTPIEGYLVVLSPKNKTSENTDEAHS